VHWLRARAQKNRWSEELTLVKYEMEWTTRFFLKRAADWRERAGLPTPLPGPRAYAARQASQWSQMASEAERVFAAVYPGYIRLVP
jgi:hypothetical protein